MKFIGIAILVLAASVLIAALPDLQESHRKNEFLRKCTTKESNQRIVNHNGTGYIYFKEWQVLHHCHLAWTAG